nr:hypothetical protein [Aquicoccus sp. G2-2]MEA1112880.1 hypothetical protein [Aquicoccus sp. G2-2]
MTRKLATSRSLGDNAQLSKCASITSCTAARAMLRLCSNLASLLSIASITRISTTIAASNETPAMPSIAVCMLTHPAMLTWLISSTRSTRKNAVQNA